VIDPAVSGIAPAAAIVQAVLEIAQAWVIDPAVSGIARAAAIVQVLGAAEQTAEAEIVLAAVMSHAVPEVGIEVLSEGVALEASAGWALGPAARGALPVWELRGAAVEEAAVLAAEEVAVAGGSQP
jgi:hypothetical protein